MIPTISDAKEIRITYERNYDDFSMGPGLRRDRLDFVTNDPRVLEMITAGRVAIQVLDHIYEGFITDVYSEAPTTWAFPPAGHPSYQHWVKAHHLKVRMQLTKEPLKVAEPVVKLDIKFDAAAFAKVSEAIKIAADQERYRQQMMGSYVTVKTPAKFDIKLDPAIIQRAAAREVEADLARWRRFWGRPAPSVSDPKTGIKIRLLSDFHYGGSSQDHFYKSYVSAAEANKYFDENCYIKKEKPLKIRNRFYVAADRVTSALEQNQVNEPSKVFLADGVKRTVVNSGKWTRPTLKAAIAHAEEILDANPSQEHVAITQIVRIVRRKKAPLVVETVK